MSNNSNLKWMVDTINNNTTILTFMEKIENIITISVSYDDIVLYFYMSINDIKAYHTIPKFIQIIGSNDEFISTNSNDSLYNYMYNGGEYKIYVRDNDYKNKLNKIQMKMNKINSNSKTSIFSCCYCSSDSTKV